MDDPLTDGGRRSFLSWFLGTSTGALVASVLYPVLRFMSPPRVPEAATNEVEAGSTNDPELLDKGFKIVRTCTHLDCIVEYRPGERKLWCNCHDGVYDLGGKNIAGPPPRPLEPYKVHVVADGSGPGTLVVSKA